LTRAEAVAAYDCLIKDMKAAYVRSDNGVAYAYGKWPRYSNQAYASATHGNRYVQNYANDTAKAYGNYEQAGVYPAGSKLAKDSFSVKANGTVSPGPLFVMEKFEAGWDGVAWTVVRHGEVRGRVQPGERRLALHHGHALRTDLRDHQGRRVAEGRVLCRLSHVGDAGDGLHHAPARGVPGPLIAS
jgi:hypothetical protein